jgi:hypothetical protein
MISPPKQRFEVIKRFVLILAAFTLPVDMSHAGPQQEGFQSLTQLRILARGPSGERLQLKRADIYLDIWGGGTMVSLPRDGGEATLRLDHEWLCSAAPEICSATLFDASRVILQSEGYSPVTLKVFWPGQRRPLVDASVPGADIELAATNVHLQEGSSKEVVVEFRRPVARTLRVIDDTGKGVPGIQLEAKLFFNDSNHCGVAEGETMAMGETNADGRFAVPDVDGELAIQFSHGHFELKPPGLSDRSLFVFTPVEALTTISIHRFDRQPLRLMIVNPHGSAAGLQIEACLKNAGCGANCGDLSESDSKGNVYVEDFYPEEIGALTIKDNSGVTLWQQRPPLFSPSQAVQTITLP